MIEISFCFTLESLLGHSISLCLSLSGGLVKVLRIRFVLMVFSYTVHGQITAPLQISVTSPPPPSGKTSFVFDTIYETYTVL